MNKVAVNGSFDNFRSRHVRLLEEASKLGDVTVFLWSDAVVQAIEGKPARLPEQERLYLIQSMRYVSNVILVKEPVSPHALPNLNKFRPNTWVLGKEHDTRDRREFAESKGIHYHVLTGEQLDGFEVPTSQPGRVSELRKKVVVTGCFDWLHSGHVRFFEEVSQIGVLYVVVGHDKNIELLKGAGHPMFSQQERRYMVHAVRYVEQALISSGEGWMDAAPEFKRICPDVYVVNEDGDKPEKRTFCETSGIEYMVLKRAPKEGLPSRESTVFRGF